MISEGLVSQLNAANANGVMHIIKNAVVKLPRLILFVRLSLTLDCRDWSVAPLARDRSAPPLKFHLQHILGARLILSTYV